ncbi:MAG: stage II sporulation protein M [Bacteroidota bacterium]
MRETKFIEQNKEKWLKFERELKVDKKDPDKLSELFVQITDDLSYSRTFYPNRSIRVYLNNIAQQLFYSIYKNRKEKKNAFIFFWKEELPYIVFHARKELFLSLFVFLFAVTIGIVSSINDPEFARVILGDRYVEMTKENIASGDPMAVYKESNEIDMFLGITINNIRVAFGTFITGVLFAIGSIGILIVNGVMVGSFQYFFIERGLFQESFLTIWLHGTLEISSIIIAGGAGILLGRGLVFPGTYSRLYAFQLSARRGLKLMLGIVPILTFAAIIESFMTRYTETPDIIRGAIIFLSALFIILYFVWYPYAKSRNGFAIKTVDPQLPPTKTVNIDFEGAIKSSGEIFKDVFGFYKLKFKKYFKTFVLFALLFTPVFLYLNFDTLSSSSIFYYDNLDYISTFFKILADFTYFIDYQQEPLVYLLNGVVLSALIYIVCSQLSHYSEHKALDKKMKFNFTRYLNVLVLTLMWSALFFINGFFSFVLFCLIAPLLITASFLIFKENKNLASAISRVFELTKSNYSQLYGVFFLLFFIGIIFFAFVRSPFLIFYLEVLGWSLPFDQETINTIFLVVNTLVTVFGFLIAFPFLLMGHAIQYFSFKEINEANNLNTLIKSFGTTKTR